MRLFNLAEELRATLDEIEEAPELSAEQFKLLEGSAVPFENKLEGVALRINEIKLEIEARKEEVKRQQAAIRTLDRQSEWLKAYCLSALESVGLKRHDGERIKVRRQKSGASVRVSERLEFMLGEGEDIRPVVGDPFVRVIPERYELDKTAIVKHYKETGEIVAPELIEIDDTAEHVVVW